MGLRELEGAKQQLRESDLAFPPVPSELVGRFEHFGPWNWGSRPLNPLSMYMFEHFASRDDQRVFVPEDYIALCHAGHGVNSYALTYHLVYRPVAIIFQVGWGGVYMDSAAAADLFKRHCELSASLVERASRARATRGSWTELGLVQSSDLGSVNGFDVVDTSGPTQLGPPRQYMPFRDLDIGLAYEQAQRWLADQL